METVLRVAIIYVFIMVGLRLLGKREFSQLSPLELVTLLIIPELVSQALVREDFSLTNALIGTTTLLVLVYLTSLLQYNVKVVDHAISGEPTVLVRRGKYIEKHMHQERVSPEEIASAMRESGIAQLNKVRWAVLEPDGKISIVPEEEAAAGGAHQNKTDELIG